MGEYEPYVKNFIQKFAKGVCVDAGAGVGVHTIVMANCPNVNVVYAFEPIPYNYAKIYAYRHPKIKVMPFALGELEGELEMVCPSLVKPRFAWVNARKPFRKDPRLSDCRIKLRVPMRRLDSFVKKVDFIKIDVEGMEFQVIRGAGNAINKAFIIVELHNWGEYNQEDLIKYLSRTHELTSPWRKGYELQHVYFKPK